MAPGITLGLRIFYSLASVSRTHQVKKAASCVFVPPPSADRAIEVSVAITAQRPSEVSWVGKNAMGTGLIGSCELSEREHLSVVWRESELPRVQDATLSSSNLKRLADDPGEQSRLGMMLWGFDAQGVAFLLVGRLDETGAAKIREQWRAKQSGS